jgi:DNA excision repair protein ERCC-6
MQVAARTTARARRSGALDDGDETLYQMRLAQLREKLSLDDPADRKRRRAEDREMAASGDGEDAVQKAFQAQLVKTAGDKNAAASASRAAPPGATVETAIDVDGDDEGRDGGDGDGRGKNRRIDKPDGGDDDDDDGDDDVGGGKNPRNANVIVVDSDADSATPPNDNDDDDVDDDDDENEIENAAADDEDEESSEGDALDAEFYDEVVVLDHGLKVPTAIYGKLFNYQKTCVKWFWELHRQGVGGILGDEMGLGKTVQVIAFLAALHRSGHLRCALIVCPATVMSQWVREFHRWSPLLRVALLHDSGTARRAGVNRAALCRHIARAGDVLITTYDGVKRGEDTLLKQHWDYVILDEGHKIRNPDAGVTLAVKKFSTPHRIVLSGSPIQNNLTELWSLFDFVYPGKLGTLPVFEGEFGVPISIGGYVNASQVQVQAAYRCAVMLRDMVSPFLLRRMKKDVLQMMPAKSEHVLFCDLTEPQERVYLDYLRTDEVREVLTGSFRAFRAISILRKVCNHPDLLLRDSPARPEDFGNPARSGKLRIVRRVVPLWRAAGHRALIFTQTRQMLDVLESTLVSDGVTYRRLDGCTPIARRLALIDEFNSDPEIAVFLLTTRVGGLGVNLTGADRVILFDPDWNPSTDAQARERAWRLGQTRPVTVFRLLTRGTIEEKMYHRQIFKHFLTDRVLRDPKQQRFFRSTDLAELFTYTGGLGVLIFFDFSFAFFFFSFFFFFFFFFLLFPFTTIN